MMHWEQLFGIGIVQGMAIKLPRLKRHIMEFMLRHREASVPFVLRGMQKFYPTMTSNELAASVDGGLLELWWDREIQILSDDRIELTMYGEEKAKSLKAAKDDKISIKQRNRYLNKRRLESKRIHEDLKAKVAELGKLIGKVWKQEHELAPPNSPVVVDIVWYAEPGKTNISHAFEIQHRGNWKNAIHNLEAVSRRHTDCKLFLLVKEPSDIPKIKKLLGSVYQTSIDIVEARELEAWLKVLRSTKGSKVPKRVKELGIL